MPIYTKTGDGGKTSVFDGQRISKASPQIFACGSLDELSSFIGLTINETGKEKKLLSEIQIDLYQIMAFLSGANVKISLLNQRVKFIEQVIDDVANKLPKLNRFILPQGSKTSNWFHILRTVCRRAERVVVSYYDQEKKDNPIVIVYLNRLSDLFFILARKYNQNQEISV
jgi:cob(I)alamin adenosyltransferase